MASGDTKTEAMLRILGNGGSADAYRGCCNTKTQSYVLDAIDRVQGLEDEVAELKNNPDVADIVATYADLEDYDTSKLTNNAIVRVLEDEEHDGASTYYRYSTTTQEFTYIGEVGPYYTEDEIDTLLAGKQDTLTAGTNIQISNENVISATDTTYNAFTGTDGTAAGTAGLVPAPATTDAGKFLKADGTWDTAGGGSEITELTSADYNYPTSGTANRVALWLLPAGTYYAKNTVLIATSSSTSLGGGIYSVAKVTSGVVAWYGMYSPTPSETVMLYGRTEVSTGSEQSSASKTVATLSDIFPNPSDRSKIVIGDTVSSATTYSIAIGGSARCLVQSNGVAIGNFALCKHPYSISLGASGAGTTEQGQLQLGLSGPLGYNNSTYRIISGVYDGQSAHDAATYGQLNTRLDGLTLLKISQTDYDNLQTKDANTLYVITGA